MRLEGVDPGHDASASVGAQDHAGPEMTRSLRCRQLRRRVYVLITVCCGFTCLTLLFIALSCPDCVMVAVPGEDEPFSDPGKPRVQRMVPDEAGIGNVEKYRQHRILQSDVESQSIIHSKNKKYTDRTKRETLSERALIDDNGNIYVDDDSESARAESDDAVATYPDRQSSGILRTHQKGGKNLPKAIIIGVKKAGTRALLQFIRLHPDVRAMGPEPHFFDRHYHRGLDWYRRQMPTSIEGQITMEKTPSYFVTKEVPKRIHNMSRDVKLIIVVRDPVTRAISDYTQTISKRPGLKPFDQMAFLDNTTRLVDTSWSAIRIGVYAKHLERWLQYFPLDHLHFVSGEKLITDPAGELAKLQDFLGLKRIINEKHFFFNETKGFPCLKKPEGSGNPHCLGKTKGRQHPYVQPEVLQRLRDFYRPFNAKFYQMVGQDFGWQ